MLTLTVPPDRAAGLRDALEQLQLVSRGADDDTLAHLRAALETGTGHPLAVTAPGPVLRELIAVALDEAGETLGAACTRLLRGEGTAVEVRAQLVEVAELLDLLDAVEQRA